MATLTNDISGAVDSSLVNKNRSLQSVGMDLPQGTSGGTNLFSTLDTAFNPTANTIMGNYAAAKGLTQQATKDINTATTDRYGQDISFQQQQDVNTGKGILESGRGFVINPGAVVAFQQQADKRVKDLRNQMNDALLQNNATGAKALADLMVNEQSAITNARTAFLNQYFGAQTESRAAAGFQTPGQKAVQDLSTTYTDAGILPTDTLEQATAKVKGSKAYQLNIQKGEADIQQALATTKAVGIQAEAARTSAGASVISAQASRTLAGAQAALAGVQTQQRQRILNSLNDPTAFAGDVSALLNGTMTASTLTDKYKDYPEGTGGLIISNIISQAQAKGFNPTQSELNYIAKKAQTQAWSGGNLFNMFGSFLGGAGSAASSKILSDPTSSSGTTQAGIPYVIK